LNDVEPTVSRKDLILQPDYFTQNVALNMDCSARKLLLTDMSSLERIQSLD